jgi:transketolase
MANPATPAAVEHACGDRTSAGQGLPDGVGVALAGRYLDELPYRVWVLCGDSEMAEGSMWEALDKAAYYRLANLTAIVDVNRLGQRGPTELGWDLDFMPSGLRGSAVVPFPSKGTTSTKSTRRSPPWARRASPP